MISLDNEQFNTSFSEVEKVLTYGILPDEQDFFVACNHIDDDGTSVSEDGFSFGDCSRLGDTVLDELELWDELQLANQEFHDGIDEAGEWCSAVLTSLGFEWV